MSDSIIIPRVVDRIGSFSFAGADNLKTITIPKDVSYIAVDAFSKCKSLKIIYCEFGPKSLTGAPWGAPANCETRFNCFYEEKGDVVESGGIDLSFITAAADDILDGKISVDAKGKRIEGNIPIVTASQSGNTVTVPVGYVAEKQTITISGVDTSGATVTADKMLDGVKAINSDGDIVTGTIKTVTATLSGNVATVPAGYIAEKQTLTVPAVTPTLADNVVSVPKGYISSEQTLTVAEMAEPTVSANIVTIAKGYNKAQKTVTVAEASAPTVSGNVVTVNKGYQSAQKKVTVGTAKAAATITPGTQDQTIAAGTYLTGAQTIKGDANLKAENIADGIKIFGVTGTFAGGGADLSFALITHYNPYAAAYEVVTSVGVFGFGIIGETDYSFVNGTFTVTDATAGESDPIKRVYKNGDYYLYWYSEMGDRMYGRWYIGKVAGSSSSDVLAYQDNFSEEVPSGTNSWYEQINWSSFSVTTNPSTVTVPEVPERLTAVSVTDYDPDTGLWTPGGAVEISSFEKTPATDDVFAVKGGLLVGSPFSNKYPLAVPEEPTSHYDNGWIIGASTNHGERMGYQAFVRYGQEWHSQSGHPQWLSWRNEKYKYCIKKYTLYNRPDEACQSLEWKIQGSDNGIDWTDIDHVVLESAEYGSIYAREIAENTKFFRIHRFYSMQANDNYTTVEFFTARGERMPDVTSGVRYILTGAGEDLVNGEYIATGYNNDKGYPVYTNGICYFAQVYESTSQAWNKYWYVYKPYPSADPLNPGSNQTLYYLYYPTGGSSGDQFWNNSSGSDPLPSLEVVE